MWITPWKPVTSELRNIIARCRDKLIWMANILRSGIKRLKNWCWFNKRVYSSREQVVIRRLGRMRRNQSAQEDKRKTKVQRKREVKKPLRNRKMKKIHRATSKPSKLWLHKTPNHNRTRQEPERWSETCSNKRDSFTSRISLSSTRLQS